MTDYKYERLDLDQPVIRLFRLCRGTNLEIEGELFQALRDGEDTIPYDALSYTWIGDSDHSGDPAHIRVDGRNMAVTESLLSALKALRYAYADRVLWIDAICIDQGNAKEKGHQVQQMTSIYKHAESVRIWLGPATFQTDLLMDTLNSFQSSLRRYITSRWVVDEPRWVQTWWKTLQDAGFQGRTPDFEDIITAMERLSLRRWFSRIWVVQEVANARVATVHCGNRSISARIFAMAPSLLQRQLHPRIQTVLDVMPGPVRESSWWSHRRGLYTLLTKFAFHEATDQRDMVYALLGLADNKQETVKISYTSSVSDVLERTHRHMFCLFPDGVETIEQGPARDRLFDLIPGLHQLSLYNGQDRSSRHTTATFFKTSIPTYQLGGLSHSSSAADEQFRQFVSAFPHFETIMLSELLLLHDEAVSP